MTAPPKRMWYSLGNDCFWVWMHAVSHVDLDVYCLSSSTSNPSVWYQKSGREIVLEYTCICIEEYISSRGGIWLPERWVEYPQIEGDYLNERHACHPSPQHRRSLTWRCDARGRTWCVSAEETNWERSPPLAPRRDKKSRKMNCRAAIRLTRTSAMSHRNPWCCVRDARSPAVPPTDKSARGRGGRSSVGVLGEGKGHAACLSTLATEKGEGADWFGRTSRFGHG